VTGPIGDVGQNIVQSSSQQEAAAALFHMFFFIAFLEGTFIRNTILYCALIV
jgi:hypothetical protein